jgi:F0F1-type ATP synthase membrane subunit b/b'
MTNNNDSAQGDIVGWIFSAIVVVILLWLFFFVILPALIKATPH